MISDRKLAANRRKARKGGRPTRKQDVETDRLAQEILQRHDTRAAKAIGRKLLEAIKAGDSPAMPATPTNVGKATDSLETLIAELLRYSGVSQLSDVQWRQIYMFTKREDLEGSPRRTELFRAWQETQELPEIDS